MLWAAWAVGLHAQNIVISEFLASNRTGTQDEDAEFSDWIEIFNAEQAPVSLAGWHLTDDSDDLSKWPFPEVAVPGRGFLLVYASGKDRRDPKAPLHTNFSLERDGEYLALVRPDGVTKASEFAPRYPRQVADVSYGRSMSAVTEVLVPMQSAVRLLVAEDDRLGLSWVDSSFADADWTAAAMGVGYERPDAPPDPAEPLEDVTQPGDRILATSPNSPGAEVVEMAIDNNLQTKYLNFDKLNAGLTVTPSAASTVVRGLRLTSANDAPERDPTSYLLLGSNDGSAFVEVAHGSIPDFTSRFQTVEVQFTNVAAYPTYRLLFPTVRNAGAAVAVQIAEVELLGQVGPALPAFAELIKTSVEASMFQRRASIYLRLEFDVGAVRPWEHLALRVHYADGFVAWLNGLEVARANAPQTLVYDSTALTNRLRAAVLQEARFDLHAFTSLIRPGSNVLAIQGLNDAPDSPDFLIQAELENTELALGDPVYFERPSPGMSNGQGVRGLMTEPVAEPQRGFYWSPIDVTLASATPGAVIRYTTDGSEPSATNGVVYDSPIHVGRTTTLRAATTGEGWHSSRPITQTYIFLDDIAAQSQGGVLAAGFPSTWNGQAADYGLDPRVVGPAGQDRYGGKYTQSLKADLQAVPSISIVMDRADLFGPQGIYSNPLGHGGAWERAVSVELIDPANRGGFQADAGVRIQGGAFRRFDLTLKKSFRIVFREEYGSGRLRYPLFGPDAAQEFNNFVLRANSNDAWPYWNGAALYIRDTFALESARAMGMAAPRSRFVHLYLNGIYWGLYNPVERPDAAFSASYHGGDRDQWDAINQDSAPDGNYDAWNRLLAQANQGLSSTEAYQRIQGNNPDGTPNPNYENLLNVGNMIDYMILNFYVGNTDWPGRNWWTGINREQPAGFRFYPWDTETALGVTGLNVDRTGVTDAVARPYGAARANPDFRMQFADHVYRHFFNGGAFYVNPSNAGWDPAHPENNAPAARFMALAEQVSRAIVGESARWGDQLGRGPFTRDEHWQVERENLLSGFFPRRSAIVLDQFRRAGLYPALEPPVMNVRGGRVPSGFQLTLSAPEGAIYYTINGGDPRVPITVRDVSRRTLVKSEASKKALVPTLANGGSQLGANWRGGQEPFNDGGWLSGTSGVGYDQQTEYQPFIGLDVRSEMDSKNGSVFIRIPFQYDGAERERLNFMLLRVQFDDGFVAFLNGKLIASANAPLTVAWDSVATGSNPDSAAVQFQEFNVDAGLAALQPGPNVLAIQGLNTSLSSSDVLINAELIAGERLVSTEPIGALQYAGPITLQDLATVKTRVFNGVEWSALNEASFEVGTPLLSITELHYHPAGPSAAEQAAGFVDADDFEFLELFNQGEVTYDLSGLRFTAGIQFDFAASAIPRLAPGAYMILVKNRAAFELRYGPSNAIAGQYSGRLDNAGESILLLNARGETVLNFTYGTKAPWPKAADGGGPSLQIVNPFGDPASAANWEPSLVAGGSPGQPNSVAALALEMVAFSREGQLQFTFPGRAAVGYTIYGSDSLAAGSWQVLQRGEPLARAQTVQVSLELSRAGVARFYRVSVP